MKKVLLSIIAAFATIAIISTPCVYADSGVTAYPASRMIQVEGDVFDYHSCIGVKPEQEYILIYLTGDDRWYVAHNFYNGQHDTRIESAWNWPKNPIPTPEEAIKSLRVDKRRILDSHAVDDCIKKGEIAKWVILLKPVK